MNHLIPPVFPSSVSVVIPQTIQPSPLTSAAIESLNLSDDSQDLLTTDAVLSGLKSEAVAIKKPDESSFIVAEIVADSGNCLANVDADKIVERIISNTENKHEAKEQFNNNIDDKIINDKIINGDIDEGNIENNVPNRVGGDVINNVTNNVVDGVADVAAADGVVKNVSDRVVCDDVGGVGLRSRSVSGRHVLSAANRFHRLGAVRVEQGVSLSRVAKRLQLDISEVREQEKESTDLKLSQLYKWRDILEVSVGELVLEPEEIPTNPIRNRCQLVRMMKTVRSIIIESKSEIILVLARQLESQLIELMPELAAIAAWPSLGQSRDPHSPGTAATRCQGFGNVYPRRIAAIKEE
jgi:transcriptional regulator with XRE-family HTH domain